MEDPEEPKQTLGRTKLGGSHFQISNALQNFNHQNNTVLV